MGQSRIVEIGAHVGLHLMPAALSNGFHHYQLGLYVIQSGALVTVYPFASAPLLVGKTYLVEAKITVGNAGTGAIDLRIVNEVGEEVFDISVSPVLTQGSIVLNNFADILVLPGVTIGHLIIADDLVGPSLVVPFNNNGAGSLAQWAVVPAGSGPNWDVADKISFDQDTYVQATAPGTEDLYSLQSFPAMPSAAIVRAIQASILARSEFDSTPPEITALWANIPQAATVHQITPAGQVVAAALTAQVHIIDQNPNTVASFVASEMDASQLGIELL